MSEALFIAIESVAKKATDSWLRSACEVLQCIAPSASSDFVLQKLPTTNNADLYYLMSAAAHKASGKMSWEALAWSLQATLRIVQREALEQHIELLWSGPSPADQIPARRIDQALYDLISTAKREIVLVTFAAAKVERLAGALMQAIDAGVCLKLILEFQETSKGQLSFDALKAFPPKLIASSDVYAWPLEKRERNQAGKPGKLHAKLAIIDDVALVSSANLTDDAFNRNLEIGVMTANRQFLDRIQEYLAALIKAGTLRSLEK